MAKTNTHPLLTEPELISKIAHGDKSAFEVVFNRYNRSLLFFAKREVKSEQLAEDLVQDVFVGLWMNRARLDQNKSIKALLFTSLKNRILNAIRTQKNLILKHTTFTSQKVYRSAASDFDMISTEYELALKKFMASIPKSKQRILELSMQGYNNKEISSRVNLSTNTIKMYLSKIKRSIRSSIFDSKSAMLLLLVVLLQK